MDTFGWRVAQLVHAVTHVRDDKTISTSELLAEIGHSRDKDALMIKLFDRLHNLRTLDGISEEKRKEIAKETLEEFLVCAMDFGIEIEKAMNIISTSLVDLKPCRTWNGCTGWNFPTNRIRSCRT